MRQSFLVAVLFLALGLGRAQAITYTVRPGPAAVAGGQTVMPVTVEFANPGPRPQSLSGEIRIVDYFQTPLLVKPVDAELGPGERRTLSLPVITDTTGPYVKVVIAAAEGKGADRRTIDDEQIIFTDALTGPRPHVSLNGAWETRPGGWGKPALPTGGKWTGCELPYRWDTWQGDHTRWFRKRFVLPVQMRGKRIALRLSGVRFRADVFLNGHFVAGADTDQMPWDVDLTRSAKPGTMNELAMAVTDWVSCTAPELRDRLLPVWSSAWIQGREISGMPFIRPCTCGVGGAGISDPIFIIATSDLAVADCFVTPSLEKSELRVNVRLRNSSEVPQPVTLRLNVFGKDTLREVTLKPGRNEIDCTVPVDLKAVRRWWPWKPALYRCRVELLKTEQVLDRYDVRFGFREFRADGPVFRINGVAFRPNAAAGIPYDFPGLVNYDDKSSVRYWYAAKNFLRSFANVNVNLLRYHTEPYPALMLDLADEVGLPIVSEAFMATLPGKLKLDDPRLWKNLAAFYPKWVEREFNHPALVVRSMENELGYHLPAADAPRSPWGYSNPVVQSVIRHMKDLGQTVKALDPSRPIMYEGSGPVFYDVADIYNIHYPSIPGGWGLYPIDGRRLSIPSDSYIVKNWLWDRKKPLYVGEYDCYFSPPQYLAALLGNDAYDIGYMHRANAAIWSYTIPGQRMDGITAGVPWTILTFNDVGPELSESNSKLKLFKNLTAPIASFIHQYRICYFGGRTITRTITTLNDTLQSQAITVRWRLVSDNATASRVGEAAMRLDPAQSRRTQIELALPRVVKSQKFKFVVETLADGVSAHRDERDLILFPKELPRPTVSSHIGSIGLPGEVLPKLNIKAIALDAKPLDLSGVDVLLVSGTVKGLGREAARIDAFLRSGGRIVVFGGATAPDFLPVTLPMAPGGPAYSFKADWTPEGTCTIPRPDSSMTIIHPRIPDHPLLKDLNAERLKFWRENHLTADYTYLKPTEFSARAVLDGGDSLRQTPLLEIPRGRGMILAVQMPVLELFSDQPAARILLGNILAYVNSYRGPAPRPAVGVVAGAKSAIPAFVQSLGAEPYLLAGRMDKLKDLSAYAIIIVESENNVLEELAQNKIKIADYVKAGGIVWLHRPLPGHAAAINSLLPVPVEIHDLTLKSPVRPSGQDLLAGISRDELFWAEGAFLPTASGRVARYTVEAKAGPGVHILADPAVAVSETSGKGQWLIDEVAWDTEFPERSRALQFVRTILTNAGVQIRVKANAGSEKVDPALGIRSVDIRPFCNEGFLGGIWNGPTMGLHGLPAGRVVLKGVPWQIIDPKANRNKTCIGFHSAGHNKSGPKSVTIPIDCKAAGLRLLLASVWTSSLPAMTKILDVDIEYTDGGRRQAEVCYGRDCLDWCPEDVAATRTHPAAAWIGPAWPNPGLYDFLWINPDPARMIRRVTLAAAHESGFAVLVALGTQERLSAREKKTGDWIPGLER